MGPTGKGDPAPSFKSPASLLLIQERARTSRPIRDHQRLFFLPALVSSVEDGSKFAAVVRERLFTSKINQPSISLDGLITFTEGMTKSPSLLGR
ncbi:hypothetical protein MUK42_10276 [Musa troglodytarum]|uniref:Uncharacterized protein n=1 Tax=Musa troglodytarum TaxID=320322 RepID=A0A9E7EDH6_9LILI|nr:hypothetical protein MUK42_10276 [Musa troglodytarum]